jgi:hypothetical protein
MTKPPARWIRTAVARASCDVDIVPGTRQFGVLVARPRSGALNPTIRMS